MIPRAALALPAANKFKPPKRCMIHLDGKIMTDNCRVTGDILAVICSGNTDECLQGKLLSANRINNGTGEAQSIELPLCFILQILHVNIWAKITNSTFEWVLSFIICNA